MAGDFVLVTYLTGATGFIGFRVLVLLLEEGYNVRTAVPNLAGFEKIKALKSAAPYQSQMEHIIVPDIAAAGAYDEAVKGVKFILHVASPFASPDLFTGDYETCYMQPAVKGTVGMLDSAGKVKGIERVVITASILSTVSFAMSGADTIINENHRSATTQGSYPNWISAYAASKSGALKATEEWMAEHNPSLDLINIEPVFVLGRDETAADINGLLKGSNGMLMGPVLGQPSQSPSPGIPVHVDDVAMMHVRLLNPAIPGNQDYLACSHPLRGIQWAESFDIVKAHYPKKCAEDIFKVGTTERPQSVKLLVDSSKAEKIFGFTFKSFEEQVLSVVGQYLELAGK